MSEYDNQKSGKQNQDGDNHIVVLYSRMHNNKHQLNGYGHEYGNGLT